MYTNPTSCAMCGKALIPVPSGRQRHTCSDKCRKRMQRVKPAARDQVMTTREQIGSASKRALEMTRRAAELTVRAEELQAEARELIARAEWIRLGASGQGELYPRPSDDFQKLLAADG